MIRAEAGLTVTRFCELLGVPRRTYQRWKAAGDPTPSMKGPWPAPIRDRIEQPAAQLALEWPAWGHRKIHALLAVDGFDASQATVRRALARRGLLQPVGYQHERRELAKARKAAFVEAPTRATASGRPTSPSSRPPLSGHGRCRASSTMSRSSRSAARSPQPRPGGRPWARWTTRAASSTTCSASRCSTTAHAPTRAS